MDAESLREVVLVGSSLGGAIAELVALRRPDLVRALVLVDGGLPSNRAVLSAMLPMMIPFRGERIYDSLRSAHDHAVSSLRPFYADFDALPEADREFLGQRVVERVESDSQRRAYFSLLRSLLPWSLLHGRRLKRGLSAFARPILIAWGTADIIMDHSVADTIVKIAPRARIVDISRAGHLPHQERPEALAAEILGFLASI
jgi:pimeloyl-ACP methyl ester carboxylesterase